MRLAQSFVDDIRGLIAAARSAAARGVNLIQVHASFEIGRRIVEQEQKGKDRAAYGQAVLVALSERLTKDFGNGYSRTNLEYMRKFFLLYHDRAGISQPLTGKFEPAAKSQSMAGEIPLASKRMTARSATRKPAAPVRLSETSVRPFSLG